MEYTAIQETLTDHLKTLPNIPQVIDENDEGYLQSAEDVGTRTTSYLRTTLQPLRSVPSSFGIGGDDLYPVLFTINYFVPAGSGVKYINQMSDDIINLFIKAKRIAIGPALCVDITRGYRQPNSINANYTQATIIIEAESFVTRPI